MKRVIILMTVLAITAMLLAGCTQYEEPTLKSEQTTPSPTPTQTPAPTTKESVTGQPTGTINVLVTDAPKHDVSRVDLTVSQVEVHKSGGGGESGNWTALDIQEETFNLLDLQNGLTMLLADGEVETGRYTQLRMTVFKVVVDYDDVVGQQAEVPSGELKFVRPFTLEAGENITLIVDIDAAKSVIVTGGDKQEKSKVLFKPVVKLEVVQEKGPSAQSPTVLAYSPADNATGVAPNADLVLTFDNNMVAGTGNITIKRYLDDFTFETIDVTSANVTVSGTMVTINPTGTLDIDTGYYVLIDATALTDEDGNNYAGIANKETWNFTT